MSIYGYKFHEVQKYLIGTRHIFSTAKFQASEQWWNRLTPQQQQLIQECMEEAVAYGNSLVMDRERELMDEILARGITVIDVPELQLEEIREAALAIVEEMVDEGLFRRETCTRRFLSCRE